MSLAAPETETQDTETHTKGNGLPEVSELDQFKHYIYGNYHDTHVIFGNDSETDWQRRLQGHIPVMRRLLPPNKTGAILDFGCGDGLLLAAAQSLGYSDLTGVDISGALLQTAARHTSAKLRHADGLELLKTSPNGAFETIIAFDILEHLTRPELLAASREIARTLKPGGRLIIRVPNGGSAYSGQIYWSDLTHERLFTREAFNQLLKPLGFGLIEAVEIPPVGVHGLKSGLQAAVWHMFRALTVLRIASETGQLRGHILTANLHVIAHKSGAEGEKLA